jgi:hypothetical protein
LYPKVSLPRRNNTGDAQRKIEPFSFSWRPSLQLDPLDWPSLFRAPATGEFQDAVIIAQFGEVDLSALSE